MKQIETLINNLSYTYLDRFFEKLSYMLSKNLDSDVSIIETLKLLADEMAFTDDGYLYYIIDTEFGIDTAEDIKFKIEHIKNSNNYVLFVNNKVYSAFDSLSSVLKTTIEEYFN